jgi:hypothetical protein
VIAFACDCVDVLACLRAYVFMCSRVRLHAWAVICCVLSPERLVVLDYARGGNRSLLTMGVIVLRVLCAVHLHGAQV